MTIAITGACGHLGANLVRELLHQRKHVRALYRSQESLVALNGLEVEKTKIDVTDPDTLKDAFNGCDVVMHLAAIISIDGDKDGRVMRTNVMGTRNVAKACLTQGVRKLVHVSSIHAFKINKNDGRIDETHALADATCFKYDQSKALGEREILSAVDQGLDATILNPTGILGAHDYGPSHAGHMLRDLFRGRMPILVDGGFDWVDARDVSQAIINASHAGKTGERYLISGHWISFDELSRLCNEMSGKKINRAIIPIALARAGLPFARIADYVLNHQPLFTNESLHIIEHASKEISHAKAARDLTFKPRPVEETLRGTFRWWKNHGGLN